MPRHAVISDLHIPYHDPLVVDAFADFCERAKPDVIHFLGDIWDFHSASTKFKDAPKDRRVTTLKWELDVGASLLQRFDKRFPAKKIFHWGNHEDRLNRLIKNNAPALLDLVDLSPWLPEGWETFNYGGVYHAGGLSLTHGDITRGKSGNSGHAMLDKYGVSVLFGHTHRLGAVHRRTSAGIISAYENGCACLLDQSYTLGPTNWQQGWSLIDVSGSRFEVQQYRLLNGGYFYNGEFVNARAIKGENRISRGLGRARV